MSIGMTGISNNEALKTAKNCRHYAMCKVDFLGTGVCSSGLEKHYVSFYPEGRMDLFAAIVDNVIPITEKCIEIADSCSLCGRCDFQCYFVHEMRPTIVMKALKEFVAAYLKSGGKIVRQEEDIVLTGLKDIVGDFWASNDPAIRITYHHDLCPHVTFKMPEYVVMPNTKEEVSAVVQFLNHFQVPYIVRGNGASSHGLVFTEGAVIDLNRMKTITFDEKNWYVEVGPGVAAFDVQWEAKKRGYRVHTAEPSALICANIMTSGLLSTFSTAYGVSADNFIDAEFVGRDGSIFSLNDREAPNLYSFNNAIREQEAYAICVSAKIKLHPIAQDEEGILVPFSTFESAIAFTRECAIRRIGISIGILGGDFISSFIAPTKKLAELAKDVFTRRIGMPYMVLFIGDKYALRSVRDMGYPSISQKLFSVLYQGLPSLSSADWLDILDELSDETPFSYLTVEKFGDLAETAIAPSPALMTKDLDPKLRPFFENLYSRPEMTDLVYLNTFRIQSSRYCREKPCVALVCYLPINASLIIEIQDGLKRIADAHGLASGLGFLTPIDNGKRCVWEYDYYFDHNDPDETSAIKMATHEAGDLLDEYSKITGTVRQVRYVANQGCCRKENLLYT